VDEAACRIRGAALRAQRLRARVYDAIEAIYECDSENDQAWEAAWRRLLYAAEAWVGSHRGPKTGQEQGEDGPAHG
jgi:hypothetical protein